MLQLVLTLLFAARDLLTVTTAIIAWLIWYIQDEEIHAEWLRRGLAFWVVALLGLVVGFSEPTTDGLGLFLTMPLALIVLVGSGISYFVFANRKKV